MSRSRLVKEAARERVRTEQQPELKVVKPADPREALSPKQQQVWDCTDRMIKLLCGRQAGKTYWACLWLLVGAMLRPRSLSVYLALTKNSARNIAWQDIVLIGTTVLGLPETCFREHTLEVRLPNGARVLVVGTDDRRTIETWRGTKLWRVVVDEMGSQMPSLIQYFVEDILWPALVKMDGSIALLGTPGLVCEGYWWELTRPEVLAKDPAAFHWDIYDNPAIPHAAAFVAEMLARFGWTRENVKFLREWLAQWVQDAGALVYPYDPDRNGIVCLPEMSESGLRIPASSWRYEIGHDVGAVDDCAWVVWGWNPAARGAFAVYAESGQFDPDPAAVRSREIMEDYRAIGASVELVLDTGGMGKAHERLYRTKYGLSIVPAEKLGKASAIRELRGDLLSGAAKVVDGPDTDALRSEWAVLGWDDKKLVHNPRQPDHKSDAGLYGYRRVRHYIYKPDAHGRPPSPSTPDRFLHDQEQAQIKRAKQHQIQRSRGAAGRLDR